MAKKDAVETVEVEPTETVEVEATEAEAPEAEVEIDISEFTATLEAAVEERDPSTGTVPEASIAKVRAAYQALDGIKPKNAAKLLVGEQMKQTVVAMDATKALALMTIQSEALVAGKAVATKAPVDPTEAYVESLAILTLALYVASQDVPEGVDGDAAKAAATERANEAFPEAVAVSESEDKATDNALISAALKVASSKRKAGVRRVSTGERRDIGAHISEAFAAVESGTFLSVADIRKFESTQYGKEHPSSGAITNRLKPKSGNPTTVEGITVEQRDGRLGAVKN